MARRQVGVVSGLFRYPVKSMLGESVAELAIDEGGAEGDRAWALRDPETGHVLTAKKWPQLLAFRAQYSGAFERGAGTVVVRLPGGETVRAGEPGASEAIASALGAEARLERTGPGVRSRAGIDPRTVFSDVPVGQVRPGLSAETMRDSFPLFEGTFFDSAPLHVLASGTLAHLRTLVPAGTPIDPRRFRPNIYVDTGPGGEGFVEDGWLEGELLVGDSLRVTGMRAALRCVMTTHAQEELPQALDIFRAAVRHHEANAGVFASVGSPGVVRVGDPVFLEA